MYIISKHIVVAVGTVKNAFKLVMQLVSQRRSLSWVSRGKCENVNAQAERSTFSSRYPFEIAENTLFNNDFLKQVEGLLRGK